jgi:hypothetical protein
MNSLSRIANHHVHLLDLHSGNFVLQIMSLPVPDASPQSQMCPVLFLYLRIAKVCRFVVNVRGARIADRVFFTQTSFQAPCRSSSKSIEEDTHAVVFLLLARTPLTCMTDKQIDKTYRQTYYCFVSESDARLRWLLIKNMSSILAAEVQHTGQQ